MKYLFVGTYNEHGQIFESLDDLLQHYEDEGIDLEASAWRDPPKVYEIPDNLKQVRIVNNPMPRYAISGGTASETLATAGTLPAPLEGETVADYARRLTNG